ncbi:MAG TPA: COX15/CtaA family protein [Chitinophagaceae bacterium]|nr:COX15/CtaA family protein [Chitinophagaceae bacterium]HPH31713.1 COX15/CtaA family protein [Chitinophagaceae bacterium]HPN58358.1 COX15/CtaA family protein [Chitinophagaceae bacterium]
MTTELNSRSSRPIAIWLLVGVGMIIIQVLLGGITRLTGSGLSITEWNVVTGTLPPMNEQQWMTEFDKYQQTPQYQLLNSGFTIKDFKFIFFWEWFHRVWARLIGVVFAVPFIIFLIQKRFKPSMVKPMLILFLLGALQGAIGWIMVASGLTGDAIYVKPAKLALHFVFALGLLAYTFWFAMELLVPKEKIVYNKKIHKLTIGILAVLLVQLVYGAFMAGHKAATAAPTWPDINGSIIPPNMFGQEGGLLDLIDNRITIHFIHRGLAYILLAMVLWQANRLFKSKATADLKMSNWLPAFLVLLQLGLGIFSVLSSTEIIPNKWGFFEWIAQLHQLVAMALLLSQVWLLYIVRRQLAL